MMTFPPRPGIEPLFRTRNYGSVKVSPWKMVEKDIQDQILDWLKRQKNVFVWRQNAGSMFVDGPTGRHGFRAASVQGISDIIGIWKTHAIAIEVKQPKKKPTELQRGFLKDFARAGGVALVVHSLDELIKNLKDIEDHNDTICPHWEGYYEENA